MQGYKTLTANALIMLYAILSYSGIVIPENEQSAITAGVLSIVGVILRYMTTTPVGGEEEIKPLRKPKAKK